MASVPWGSSTKTPPQTHYYKIGNAAEQSIAYAPQYKESRDRITLQSGPYTVTGWHLPSQYWMWAYKISHKSYSYEGKLASGAKVKRHGSLSPVNNNLGPGDHVRFHGLKWNGTRYVPDVDSNIRNRAVTEAMAKLADMDLNMAVSLAEAPMAIRMIAERASKLIRAFRACVRGNFPLCARILGTRVHGSWLEYQYGWLPLLSDIYGLSNFLKRLASQPPKTMRVVREVSSGYPPPASISNIAVNYRAEGESKVGCKVILYASVDSYFLSLLKGLGLTNPLLIAWELIPFSFVLDWVLPIGTWLQALGAPIGLDFLSGTSTTFAKSKYTLSWYVDKEAEGSPMSLDLDVFAMDRQIHLTWPWPKVYFKSPFSTTHIISAIALINGRRR